MNTIMKLKQMGILPLVGIATLCGIVLSGCTDQPSMLSGNRSPKTYILPSTLDTFNVGQIHNAELIYIFSHYDTTKYASYPNKFSETGIDSLAALFIADSLQNSSGGSLSSGEISAGDSVFNDWFDSSAYLQTHSGLAASVGAAESRGFLASDEASFIIQADTEIWKCASYAETNDTISSLISQYNSKSWAPSTSKGVEAYEYLSIANASCHLWGLSSGNGGTNDPEPIAAHPIQNDADAYATALNTYQSEMGTYGWSQDQVTEMAAEASSAASAKAGVGNGDGPQGGSAGNDNNGTGSGGFPSGSQTTVTVVIVIVVVLLVLGIL